MTGGEHEIKQLLPHEKAFLREEGVIAKAMTKGECETKNSFRHDIHRATSLKDGGIKGQNKLHKKAPSERGLFRRNWGRTRRKYTISWCIFNDIHHRWMKSLRDEILPCKMISAHGRLRYNLSHPTPPFSVVCNLQSTDFFILSRCRSMI